MFSGDVIAVCVTGNRWANRLAASPVLRSAFAQRTRSSHTPAICLQMRRLSISLVLLVALAWVGSSSASARPPAKGPGNSSVVRGIVQSVSQNELVVRTLDGSTVRVAVDPSTRIRVNGQPASILAIRPGFVVVVTQHGNA